jgi:seryl-tRNA synthetase
MSRRQLEKSGYLKSFPHFLGCVSCLGGPEAEVRAAVDRFDAGEDWTPALSPADLVLSPAACYPVYPLVASRGDVPAEGLLFDVACDCFRREPSKALDRLQSFRMREYVCVGSPEQINEFRRRWMTQAQALAGQLGLTWRIDHASDPFFGRGGKLMAASQVEQQLKFELLVPVRSAQEPTACMSFTIIATISASPGTCAPPPAPWRIPVASPSASTGWCSRYSQHTGSTLRAGRLRSARR